MLETTRPIQKYMTKFPHSIGEDMPLSKAKEMMAEHGIRHLPVQNRAKVVGIISDRDIHVAYALHPTAKDLLVKDVMTEDPYVVSEKCPLLQVVTEMARHKYGCAIVENEKGRAVGIFTAVDALYLTKQWLEEDHVSDRELRIAY